jgi:hypothetical protein
MVTVANGGYYHGPSYVVQKALLSQKSCEAGCLANAACVQMTWAPKHAGTQCVFYDRIDDMLLEPKPGDPVVGKVKCNASMKVPAARCAPFSPGGRGSMVPGFVRYTQIYDGIVSVLAKDHPELEISALCLAQGAPVRILRSDCFLSCLHSNQFFSLSAVSPLRMWEVG